MCNSINEKMELHALFNDKSIKSKEKTEKISEWLLDNAQNTRTLLDFAEKSKPPVKAACIEAMEFATNQNAEIMTREWFSFVTQSLLDIAPRVKWESAKVIGHTAHLFENDLEEAINNLLSNVEHQGTVVRWSAAYALGQIIKIGTSHNKELMPLIEAICVCEDKNSIKKVYLNAIKRLNK